MLINCICVVFNIFKVFLKNVLFNIDVVDFFLILMFFNLLGDFFVLFEFVLIFGSLNGIKFVVK